MLDDITPEERLLKLIRTKAKRPDASLHPQKTKAKIDTHPSYKLDMVYKQLSGALKIFTFKRINIVLSILIILGVGYLIFELLVPQPSPNLEKLESSIRQDKKLDAEEKAEAVHLKDYSYYSQRINTRDIFNAPFLSPRTSGASLDSSLGQRIANLTLVGIVLDKIPQAIIEDKKENKTYFLNKGDYIGEIKIDDISESKVVLSYEGEKFEMVP